MKIAFSLKWLLIGVTYAAIAAAACGQRSFPWKDFLWLIDGFAVLYAALAVGFLRGRRQAIAAGFLLFAVAYGAGLNWLPGISPTPYLGEAFGLGIPVAAERANGIDQRMEALGWEMMIGENAGSEEYRQRVWDQYRAARGRASSYVSDRALESAVNAIAVMFVGLIGCLAGAHVWSIRNRKRQTE